MRSEHVGYESDALVISVRDSLLAFAASDDDELAAKHVPFPLPALLSGARATHTQVVAWAHSVWGALLDPAQDPRPTHAVLMKVYQLDHAAYETRYRLVLLDEAPDCTAAQLSAVLRIPDASKVIARVVPTPYRFDSLLYSTETYRIIPYFLV